MIKLQWCRWLLKPAFVVVYLHVATDNINAQEPVWSSPAYSLYHDRVVQDKFVATALSRDEIVSNYKSPANEFKTAAITFKFSINGKDNEMLSGADHHFSLDTENVHSETPLIRFGRQLKPLKGSKPGYLKPGSTLKLRLDMRAVMKEFDDKGYYTAFNGNRIYKEDFKGVYVAGSSYPLIWDFDNLVHHPELQLKDDDRDGIYELLLDMNATDEGKTVESRWKREHDLSAYPMYQSSYLLADALYNLSLDEMVRAVEPDTTLRTGKEWAGVWTRDVSYSIILSMAHLQPLAAKMSLLRKVNSKKKIIQDTGTGGAWPVSTDRMIWAIAAWELYKVTGDKQWLQEAYEVIRNSIYADMEVAYDRETGLIKGESSFLDWREQTYPEWMQPADIFESLCLGTNAVHYKANSVAAEMAKMLNDEKGSEVFSQNANRLRKAINEKFWLPGKNYYSQFLYGRVNKIASPRAEALGSALCVLFGIADEQQSKQMVSSMPVTPYGISCIFPQIPGIPPYHNNGIWPFVQSYWLWTAAMAGNENAVLESIASIYRPAALFVTNKENFVAGNGDYAGTQINSSNMLWSLAGNISIVHRVLFGIQFEKDQLIFKPFVPSALAGTRSLENFRYREAVLDIKLEGYGNEIASFLVDGTPVDVASFPASMVGKHKIEIKLKPGSGAGLVNHQPVFFTKESPKPSIHGRTITWHPVAGAVKYRVLVNGREAATTVATSYVNAFTGFSECQVIAVDKGGNESFASEPLYVNAASGSVSLEFEETLPASTLPYKGYLGKGFIETSTTVNTSITVLINVNANGEYVIDTRYANGNGPINTDSKCAIRDVLVDGRKAGTLVFPHRGKDEWSDWGWSNCIRVQLRAGKHEVKIVYGPENENMNIATNQALLDQLRLRKLK